MHLAHLALTDFRTFARLEIDLQPGLYVITAPNAGGKSNLLEGISLLATARSPRSGADAELIAWRALAEDALPAARLSARVESAEGQTALDIAVIARPAERGGGTPTSRRFRVNGVARRASNLIGKLRVVMFSAEDLRITDGPPSGRRRYLDITISQLDAAYVRALQRYGRVLQQRNVLLRRLQERRTAFDELDFWDDELAASGAVVLQARARALVALGRGAAERHTELSPGDGPLEVCYRPAVPDDLASALDGAGLAERLRAALGDARRDDVRAGLTRIGPHRDDVSFLLAGRDAGAFASRGERRTIALALRLAEVAFSTERTGEPPVLLLDDILSELDAERRERVLATAYGVDQVIITSADEERPAPAELPGSRRYRIVEGELEPAPGSAGGA